MCARPTLIPPIEYPICHMIASCMTPRCPESVHACAALVEAAYASTMHLFSVEAW